MIRARIYTENKELHDLCRLVSEFFDSYTVYGGGGVWNGKHEPSITIEIIADSPRMQSLEDLCRLIKDFNKQEAVLYTLESIRGELI